VYEGLFAPDPPDPERPFGTSVAVAGNRVAIGAPSVHGQGAAYVVEKVGDRWVRAGAFTDFVLAGRFGAAVSLRGEALAIGAPATDSVYVVNRLPNGWPQPREPLQAVAHAPGTALGASVSLGDGLLAAGAPGGAGAVHLFVNSSGSWRRGPLPPPPDGRCRQGAALSLLGDHLAVGEPCLETPGRALLLDRTAQVWTTLAEGDGMGTAVALSQHFAVVASQDSTHGGRVTVLSLTSPAGDNP
jgi:hypothetical protein